MRTLIKLAAVLGLLLIPSTGCRCRKWVVEEPALKTMEMITPESVYPMVRSIVDEWQPEALVCQVIAAFPGNNLEHGPDRISYLFATELQGDRQGTAWLDVYPREGQIRIEACGVAYTESPAVPLAFDTALVSSTEALQAAEAAGGKPYREGETDVTVFVSTEWLGDDEMAWVVRYLESGSLRGLYRFAVDAHTGEVLDPR